MYKTYIKKMTILNSQFSILDFLHMKRYLVTGLSLFLLFGFISCKKSVPSKDKWDDTIDSGFIRIASDENFKNLINAEIDAFEAHNSQAIILPIYTSEAEAIRLLIADSVRLALTTRDLNGKEKAQIEKNRMSVRKHLIAFEGVALITNKINPDSLLGLPVLKKILTGEITEWSQINPDSPLGTIRVIFDNKESGILRYAIDSITMGETLSSNLYALNSIPEAIDKVVQMPNTIGIVGFNLLSDETSSITLDLQSKIRLMRISKEEQATLENSYLPYAGDIMQENYPLWRPVYVLLSDPRSGLSSGFSIFLAHDVGQVVILKSGLLPITDPQIKSVSTSDKYPQNKIDNNSNK
jgi:phosphate transport system substrate-binding protein